MSKHPGKKAETSHIFIVPQTQPGKCDHIASGNFNLINSEMNTGFQVFSSSKWSTGVRENCKGLQWEQRLCNGIWSLLAITRVQYTLISVFIKLQLQHPVCSSATTKHGICIVMRRAQSVPECLLAVGTPLMCSGRAFFSSLFFLNEILFKHSMTSAQCELEHGKCCPERLWMEVFKARLDGALNNLI